MAQSKHGAVQKRPGQMNMAGTPLPSLGGQAPASLPGFWKRGRIIAILMLVVSLAAVSGFAMLKLQEKPGRSEDVALLPPALLQNTDAGEQFIATRPEVKPAPFDGKRAMGYLEAICKIGTRMSGTDGMKKQQELIEKHFKDLGGNGHLSAVQHRQGSAEPASTEHRDGQHSRLLEPGSQETCHPLLALRHPAACRRGGESERCRQPFFSANDGGSGIALLMELGNHMKDLDIGVGVDFVFFDGEEYVWERNDDYFFGSKYFAAEAKKNKGVEYPAAILLDMVAGKNLRLPVEQNSWRKASKLVREVYTVAQQQGCDAFKGREFSKWAVEDDHMALNEHGIPAIDLIDFDYPQWHKLDDVPANCSGDSMTQVSRVLSVWLQRTK